MLRLLIWHFLRVRCDNLKHPESNESYESNKEETNEIGYSSGSFSTCGTCLGGLLRDIVFYAGVTPVGDDWPFDGNGESFVPQYCMGTVYCVRTDDKLLCARDVVVENVLKRALV